MSTFLTIQDLGKVYRAAFEARVKWKNILLELGVDFASIERISSKYNDNPDDCYRDGLSTWLRGGQGTWRKLVEALSSPTVKHKDTAEEIQKYLQSEATESVSFGTYRQLITGELAISTKEQLGNGAFGQVFKGSYRGMPCAVKVLHHVATHMQTNLPMGQAAEGSVKTFDRECEFLKSFQHPHIVQYLSTEKHPTSGNTILVIELMDCNLRVYFSSLSEKSLSNDCQLSLSRDVASGLTYIHSKHIIHRDLCGDNILLKLAQPLPVAKISDFGMSRLLDPSKLSSTLTAMGHRMGYLPPEASRLAEEQYDSTLDVFSLGVVMVQIVHKLETVKTPRDRFFFAAQISITHTLKPLINECLQEDMRRRPSSSQVYDKLRFREAESIRRPRARGRQDPPLQQLRLPLTLKWRRGKDMPFEMGFGVQCVVIGFTVYVGGGQAESDCDRCTVMKLDIQREQWTRLPHYSARWFAMTSLDDQLVLVGGCDSGTDKPTNHISMFQSRKWTQPYPPINIARHSSTAVSFNNHIIVAGGLNDCAEVLSAVEILDVTSRRWYIADPLPHPRSDVKSTLLGSSLYLMGGFIRPNSQNKAVDTVDLHELIYKAKETKQSRHVLWRAIEDTPLCNSDPLSIGGSLLIVGGHNDLGSPESSIHLYQPDTRSWVKVGELSTVRYRCACSILPSGEIIIAGGCGHSDKYLCTVDFLSIT